MRLIAALAVPARWPAARAAAGRGGRRGRSARRSPLRARRPPSRRRRSPGRRRRSPRTPATLNRLRLATLLAALPAPLRDDARAIELLEPLADAGRARQQAASRRCSPAQVAERQRLAREVERLTRERRRRQGARRADRSARATDKERDKREEALRQQLEALRAIERGILEREEKLRRRQR